MLISFLFPQHCVLIWVLSTSEVACFRQDPSPLVMNATLMSDPVGETRNYRSVLTLSSMGSASCSADPKTYSEKEYVSRQGSVEAKRKMGVKDRRMMFFGKY